MSDPDAMPDPIDKAYVEAEAMLSDEAARTARRERVLAAVARGAKEASAPRARPPLWRRGGWLVAACVTGLALFTASQIYQPPQLPPGKPIAVAVRPATGSKAAGAASAPLAPVQAPTRPALPRLAKPQTEAPPILYEPPPPAGGSERGEADNAPAAGRTMPPSDQARFAQRAAAAPLPPPPPPPPPPQTAQAMSEGGAAAKSQELVVTAEKREAHLERVPLAVSAFTSSERDQADPGARLRAAAAAGHTGEVQDLLQHGAPVDAPDAAGDTALMQSIQSDHPATAAALRRHGASLDHRNQAGESARDMAKARNDEKLDQALGLGP
jgi:hypothetical protein